MLSKFAGGLGNDWTPVRALGSWIKGTNGKSQGVVPFLKVVNDTAVAVNQGGKRKGAVCAYLETWHMDIEEFIELRKNHYIGTVDMVVNFFTYVAEENREWLAKLGVRSLEELIGRTDLLDILPGETASHA